MKEKYDEFFSKLNVVQRDDPQIVTINSSKKCLDVYNLFIHFWGRIPNYLLDDIFNIVDGEVLFDPFGGSGIVIFSALEKNRLKRIVYNDINPAFVFLAQTIFRSLSYKTESIKNIFNRFKKRLRNNSVISTLTTFEGKVIRKIGFSQYVRLNKKKFMNSELVFPGLYYDIFKLITKNLSYEESIEIEKLRTINIEKIRDYPSINRKAFVSFVINRLIEKGYIIKTEKIDKVLLSDNYTSQLLISQEEIRNFESSLLQKIKLNEHFILKKVFDIKLQYPNGKKFLKSETCKTLSDLYPKWSQIILSIIWREISKTENSIIKDILKIVFLASLYDSSKMQMFHKSGWIVKSFWIPPNFGVKNPLEIFCKKMDIFLNLHRKYIRNVRYKDRDVIFLNKDICSIKELTPKPDLIITHPPYFSTVQYGELSILWNAWLNYSIPFNNEIVINRQQNKNRGKYLDLLERALRKIIEISKPQSKIVLIFQSKKTGEWKLLDKVFVNLPLRLLEIRRYKRIKMWQAPSNIFNIGKFDYVFIFERV